LQRAGFDAFLIGEHVMQSDDPAVALRALLLPAGAGHTAA
jgi:indole-3-glycerol phosphate synthase